MKAKAGKASVPAKTPAKVKAKGKPVKTGAMAQSAKKPPIKPAEKLSVKAGLKSSAKPAVKINPQALAKPGAKTTTKPQAKAAAKTPVTAAKPGITKPIAKPAVTAKNQKPAPKAAVKTVNSVLTKPAKPAAKPVAKPSAKAAIAPVDKKELKSKTIKPASVPAGPSGPAAKAKPGSAAPVPAQAAKSAQPAPAPAVATATAVPAKAGRPSSRLAQLTVPSMAQSVASTAAKSSFTQTTSLPLIVPPLPSATKKDPKLANNWKTKPVEQLSDAELLSMPDSEYMNDKQMAVFRLKLSILKQDILNSASDTTEHLREDTVVVPDPADRATIEEEHALELRTRDRERKLLKKIEQSINRIDAGDYGYCDETGEPIGVGRLLARPTATLSLEAQQRRELKQKMFGD